MKKTLLLLSATILMLAGCIRKKGDATLKGRVLDITDGEPVAQAYVALVNTSLNQEVAKTQSDASGNYSLLAEDLDTKQYKYEMRAIKTDFMDAWNYGTKIENPFKRKETFDVKIQPKAKMKLQFVRLNPKATSVGFNFDILSPPWQGTGGADTTMLPTNYDVKGNTSIKIYLSIHYGAGNPTINKDTALYNTKHILNTHTVYY